MSEARSTDDSAPGWEAIDAALARVYGGAVPKHYGTTLNYMLGGPDPLDGISAYPSEAGGRPHWHFVSYGMSELYAKESGDPAVSGWGFEFTFRLKRGADEAEPPTWALSFLQNLARYVFDTGNVFEAGHHMNLNGPIALERDTKIAAAVFAEDPQLPPIDTPNGRMAFLQVVGITIDELAATQAWSTNGLLDVMRRHNPLLVTDLARASILDDPAAAGEVTARTRAEGSSTAVLYVSDLKLAIAERGSGGVVTMTMGAKVIEPLRALLAGRIPFDRPLLLIGPGELTVSVEPGDRFAWRPAPGNEPAVLTLPANAARDLAAALQPCRGSYRVASAEGLLIEVVPSVIKDAHGNVAYVIGGP